MLTFYKWAVTVFSGIAAGLIAYAQVHEGPPVNAADAWKLLIVTLTVTGFAAGSKSINKTIDKASGN